MPILKSDDVVPQPLIAGDAGKQIETSRPIFDVILLTVHEPLAICCFAAMTSVAVYFAVGEYTLATVVYRRTHTSVSSHLTMILECVVARSIVSASSWVLNNSGRSLTPVCSTTFTNWPLVKPPASISHWCSLRIYGAVSVKYTLMNSASAGLFVAFFINVL